MFPERSASSSQPKRLMASLLGRLRAWSIRAWAVPASERAYRVSVVAILAFGLALRWVGYLGNPASLWMDEATWARRMITRSIFEHRFRPIGFMAVQKAIVSEFGPSEFWLRFLSNAASVVVLLLIPYVASRLLKQRVSRLILIFLFAAHPAAIDLAKEFKPYSLESLIHLLPIVLYLRYRHTERPLYLHLLFAAIPLSFLFAYNIAFAWPGLLLLGLVEGYRRFGRRGALAAVGAGVVATGMLVGTSFTLLRDLTTDEDEHYWSEKYDVFYTPKVAQKRAAAAQAAAQKGDGEDDEVIAKPVAQTRASWLLEKSGDVAGLPGLRRERWRPPEHLTSFAAHLASVERLFWIALHVVAIGWWAARRRLEEVLLFVMPLFVVVVCNILGQWPLGAFRTNLFLCVYTIIIAVCGLDFLISPGADAGSVTTPRRAAPWLGAAAVLTMTVIPGFAFGFDWHRRKQTWTRHHQERQLLAWLRQQREERSRTDPNREPDLLLMDAHTFPSHNFYLDFHPELGPQYRAFFKTHFKQVDQWGLDTRIKRDLKNHLAANRNPIWVVVSKRSAMDAVRRTIARQADILLEHRLGPDHLVMLVNKRKVRDGAR
jgi:hypothetical protein